MKKRKLLAIFTSLLAMGALAGCSLDNIPAGDSTTINPVPSTIIPAPSDAKSSPSSTSTTIIPSPSTISSSDKSTFTVSFNIKSISNQTVNKGECARKPTDPTMDGYTFIGWYNGDELYDFSKPVESDISLSPEWELINYEITYELNGGIVPEGVTLPTTYNYETPEYKLPNLTKEDYDFIGWIKDGETTVPASDYTEYPNHFGNVKYIANFKPHDYLADQLSNFNYRIEDDKIIIESLINKNVEELVIPEGVYGIDSAAFIENEHIKKVILPESLEYIGLYAFDNCINLIDINIPSKLTTLDSIFGRCTSLESIDISNVDTLIGNVFGYCTSLKNIKFSNNIKSIDGCIVPGCTSLKEITIPGTIGKIDRFAFENCPIEKATIPSIAIESIAYSSKIENINNVLKEVIITDGTSIPNASFYKCTALSKITLPDTITYIGYNAFNSCPLTHIDLPSSLTTIGDNAFNSCPLTHIDLPSSLTAIGDNAFKNCEFDNLIIPNTITKIGSNAFTSIGNIYYDGSIADWANIDYDAIDNGSLIYSNPMQYTNNFYLLDENGSIEFNDNKYRLLEEITPDDNLTEIKPYAFYKCKSLKKISLGDNITTIGDYAFSNCSLLKEIIVPNANTIESYAFDNNVIEKATIKAEYTYLLAGNNIKEVTVSSGEYFSGLYWLTSLIKVTLPETITTFSRTALTHCTSLETIVVPSKVKELDVLAFYECTGLKNVTLPDGITLLPDSETLANNSFASCPIETLVAPISACKIICEHYNTQQHLKSVTITSGDEIYDNTFSSCSKLESVTLPNTITTIGKAAFYNCKSLQGIDLPSSLATINENAFAFSGLSSIILPTNLTTILDDAFYGCINLKKLELPKSISYSGYSISTSVEEFYYDGTLTDWLNITNVGNSDCYYSVIINAKLYLIDENGTVEYNNNKYTLLENLVIPDGITKIRDHAFFGYQYFKTVTIPQSVTEIERKAFGVQPIEKITIENPNIIYEYKFNDCRIKEAVVPAEIIDIILNDEIRKLVVTGGTTIDLSSYYLRNLLSIVIPESVTSITQSAIYTRKLLEVYNLSNLNIEMNSTDNGLVGFFAKAIHTSLNEPSIITEDGNFIFMYLENKGYLIDYYGEIENLTLPTSFNYNNTVINSYEIYDYAFYETKTSKTLLELTIPSSVTVIGEGAFYKCNKLQKVTINEDVIEIKEHAFSNCFSLNTINLPDSLKTIGDYAFSSNPYLLSVTIPKNVTYIGNNAFENCYRLTEVYNLSSIDLNGFKLGAESIRIIHDSTSSPSILVTEGNYTFYYFNNTGYFLCYTGELSSSNEFGIEITLPESFTYENNTISEYKISRYAFYSQYNIYSVIMPQNITVIYDNVFDESDINSLTITNKDIDIYNSNFLSNSHIKKLTIPTELLSKITDYNVIRSLTLASGTTFGSNLLSNNVELYTITIHSGLTEIKENALEGCNNLETIIFEGTILEWEAITKEDGWKGDSSISTVTCSDGEVNI